MVLLVFTYFFRDKIIHKNEQHDSLYELKKYETRGFMNYITKQDIDKLKTIFGKC